MTLRRWMQENNFDWRDAVMFALLIAAFGALAVFSWWATHACAITHGGHWWCWL